MNDNLETIFQKYKYDKSIAAKSRTWFQQQQMLLAKKRIDPNKILREQRKVTRITPGKLYMFMYDPKHKDTLPYYDAFPLVFPYKAMNDGFMGLNMHYLPYFQRVQLMTRLMQFANNDSFDEKTKIRYSWSLIAGASKFKLAEACIKHYLNDHVESTFVEIPGSEWHTAMMLPVERFVGSNKNRVWGDSLRK
jgi:hypothetical protein